MALLSSEKILKLVPSLFETDINNSADVFRKLEKILIFDEGFIYFLNPDSLQLKYTYKKHSNYEIDKTFKLNSNLKHFAFSKEGKIFDASSEFVEAVELQGSRQKSYILSKISIKSTVFGIILLSKREDGFYSNADLDALNAVSSVFSYILKDMELSNVFKLQLKALKDGILEKNQAYKTIKEQNERILEADKVKNEFLANISHELRTPLNSILGFSDILSAQLYGNLNSKQEEYINDIKVSATHLLGMINEVLDMSKIESGKMQIVPAVYETGDMLSDVVNMLWIRAKEKGLEFHINVDPLLPSQLFGDEVRIKQILINVLNNAVKYTKEGAVTLSIQCKEQENGNALISYSVTDTGMGIKKESIPYLFQAFKRIDESENRYIEGTGLGLSIVKQLVELMGGDISVNSVYTKGSTFIITIPQKVVSNEEIGELDLETRHGTNQRESYRQSFEAEKARVLIVDDNEMNRMVAKKLLRDTKVMVDTAESGEKCLKKSIQTRYDVIFMDHLMPEMDGIECLHAIRTQMGGFNQNTPVVALTANAGSENKALYFREGFDGYLLKPVSGVQLEEELLRLLPKNLVRQFNTEGTAGMIEAPILEHRKKVPVMISTDTTSDLPDYLIDGNLAAVMPYRVKTEGGEFLDGVETETDGILAYMKERGEMAQSEAPKVSDYEEFFAEQLTKAQSVVHISMAESVSPGFANALEASKAFDNVMVIDSGQLSSGMGLIVLYALSCAAGGMGAGDIVQKLKAYKKQIQTSFIVSETGYLMQAGKISEKVHKLCQAFMLHPVVVLKNGRMKIKKIYVGRRKTAWKKYIASTFNKEPHMDKKMLFITYAGLTNDELKEITKEVREKDAIENIIYQKASPAVAINCGPGTFGMLFAKMDDE